MIIYIYIWYYIMTYLLMCIYCIPWIYIYIHTYTGAAHCHQDWPENSENIWKHWCIKGRRHSPDRNIWQGCGRSCCSRDRHAREDLQPDKLPAEVRKVHISTWRNEWKKRCNDAMNGSIWDAEIVWPLAYIEIDSQCGGAPWFVREFLLLSVSIAILAGKRTHPA